MRQNKKIYYTQVYGTFRRYGKDVKFDTYNNSYTFSKEVFLFSKAAWHSRFGRSPGTIEKFYRRSFCFFEPRDVFKIEQGLLPVGSPFSILFENYYKEFYETF